MKSILTVLLCFIFFNCIGQNNNIAESDKYVGGPCEGCEAVYEYGDKNLTTTDTLPDFLSQEPKLKIEGTVFKKDGKTPAKDVIVYLYHTDRKGVYPTKGDEEGWAKRHGYIRGWIKTDKSGKFEFYTFRPASYPNRQAPEHIHITVKEPGYSAYYIDDIMFYDDPLLTESMKSKRPNRGGSGLYTPQRMGDIYKVKRDIVLGLNIPGYEN